VWDEEFAEAFRSPAKSWHCLDEGNRSIMRDIKVVCAKQIRIEGRHVRVARLEADKYQFVDDPERMLEGLQRCGTRVDLFTFMQRPPETTPLYRYPMEWDNLAVLPVTTFEEWWNKQIGFKARNKAKQAEKKGVVIREVPFSDQLVKEIWAIYNETPVRQGRSFPHYGKDVDTVYAEEATFLESSVFLGAYLGERLIGFIKLVSDETGTQAGLMNIMSLIEQRDKAPTNALVAHAVKACAERGIRYLVYSNFAYGKKERDTLSDFKERNAFARMDLPRFYVPLTWRGQLYLRLGLHRRMVDLLPAPVAGRLREYRNAWNNRKLQAMAESS